jgi:tetratricopeptide (TPR) repeat protein
VRYFREAIARAPDFAARAHAGLGESLAVMGWYEYEEPREVFRAAAAAAAEALRLDPRNSSAQATAAYVALFFEWDLPSAERGFRRALELDPNSAIAHQWCGN